LISIFVSDFGAESLFLITTPLFQTSLPPDFMQVNFLPPEVDVAPALVHFVPALTAANDGTVTREMLIRMARNKRILFMAKRYQSAIAN
jgi:hypothetical protein